MSITPLGLHDAHDPLALHLLSRSVIGLTAFSSLGQVYVFHKHTFYITSSPQQLSSSLHILPEAALAGLSAPRIPSTGPRNANVQKVFKTVINKCFTLQNRDFQ